jgi:hypothetical protein
LLGLELRMYMDGGAATDNTLGDMDMGMLWADNVYFFPHYHAKARTNHTPPHTHAHTSACLHRQSIWSSMSERRSSKAWKRDECRCASASSNM